MGYHVTFVNRDVPYTCAIYPDELSDSDIFCLERVHYVDPKHFVLVKHARECIVLNKDLKDLKEIRDVIDKVMQSKYLPEKLLDRFEELTDRKSASILQGYYIEWRDELRKREINRQALLLLKSAKSMRISWKVKRNSHIIKELFDIGYGIYEKDAICDWQKGAENAFMYGYLLGVQAEKGGVV